MQHEENESNRANYAGRSNQPGTHHGSEERDFNDRPIADSLVVGFARANGILFLPPSLSFARSSSRRTDLSRWIIDSLEGRPPMNKRTLDVRPS